MPGTSDSLSPEKKKRGRPKRHHTLTTLDDDADYSPSKLQGKNQNSASYASPSGTVLPFTIDASPVKNRADQNAGPSNMDVDGTAFVIPKQSRKRRQDVSLDEFETSPRKKRSFVKAVCHTCTFFALIFRCAQLKRPDSMDGRASASKRTS